MSDEERLLGGFVARIMNFVMCIAAATAGCSENGEGGERGATSSGASACVGLWAVVGVYSRWGSVKILDGGLGEGWRQCGPEHRGGHSIRAQ